jgi:CRP-like cAMP-binding protein
MPEETPCVLCPLRKTGHFSDNTEQEIAFIQRFKKSQVRFGAGEHIFYEGVLHDQLHTVLSGWAFRYRSLPDGRRQILNFLLPGDFIGLQSELSSVSPYGVEALTDLSLCVFPRERLFDLYTNHPGLGFDLTWLCAHEQLIVDENLLSVGRRSANERLAMLLIHLYKRVHGMGLSEDGCIAFPLTQQHMADALGLSLVHTNKTLKRLRALGLFTLREGRLTIRKPNEIARLAEYYDLPMRRRPLL